MLRNRIWMPIKPVALGSLGRYQMGIFVLSNVPWLFIALQLMASAFLAAQPPYYCRSSQSQNLNRTVNITYSHSVCTTNGTNSPDLNCGLAGTAVEYDPEFGKTIVSEWNLICSESFLADLSSSAFFLGYLIGSLLAPVTSDRWGRRRPLLVSMFGLATVGTSLAASPVYWVFCILRILAGIFVAGTGVTAFVMSTEIMEPRKRSWGSTVSGAAWSIGYCLVGFVAWLLPNWRAMALGLALPSWLLLSYYWLIPESLHWYVAKGRDSDAKDWITRAAKYNKVHIDWQKCYADDGAVINIEPVSPRQILRTPALLLHTVVLAYIWFANSFIYYGLSLFTATLAGNRYLNYVLSGLVELPAHLLLTLLFNWFGRKKTMILFHALTAVALVSLPFLPKDWTTFATVVWLFGKFCVGLTFPGVWLFTGEIFPTVVRSSGTGIGSVAARVGGILAPFVGSLAEMGEAVPPLLFGSMSCVAALLVFLLPETNKRKLPDALEETDPGPVWSLIWKK